MWDLIIGSSIILTGYIVGSAREKNHFKNLIKREAELLHRMPTRADTGKKITSGQTFLVTGSVVIASDAFKDFVGNLKSFFGGRMTAQETLLDRSRRGCLPIARERFTARCP
jgi:hypothetical protein